MDILTISLEPLAISKMKRYFATLLVFAFGGFGLQAQSLLWEITKSGSEQTSYLSGTIHIQEKEVFAFDAIVEEKLKSCDVFMPELILDEINPMTMMNSMLLPDSLDLTKLLSPEEYEILDGILKEKLGTGLMPFNKMKPFFISAQLMQAEMKVEMPVALDMHLLAIARENDLETKGYSKG